MSVWTPWRNEKILVPASNWNPHCLSRNPVTASSTSAHQNSENGNITIGTSTTRWTVRGSNSRQRQQSLSPAKRPDGLWGPSSPLLNGQRRSQPGIKQPGREVHHSPAHSSGDKSEWSYTSTSPYAFMAWTRKTLLSPCISFLGNFVTRLYSSKTPGQKLAHVWGKRPTTRKVAHCDASENKSLSALLSGFRDKTRFRLATFQCDSAVWSRVKCARAGA